MHPYIRPVVGAGSLLAMMGSAHVVRYRQDGPERPWNDTGFQHAGLTNVAIFRRVLANLVIEVTNTDKPFRIESNKRAALACALGQACWAFPRFVHGPRASITQRCGGQGVGKPSPEPRRIAVIHAHRLFSQQRPSHAGVLVGHGHGRDIGPTPLMETIHPLGERVVFSSCMVYHGACPMDEQRA